MQHGPGAENAMGGVAQCYGESVPVLVLPMGYPRRIAQVDPNFNSTQAMRHVREIVRAIWQAAEVCNIFRRAFTKLKNGRGGPVIVEIPADIVERGGRRAAELHAGAAHALRRRSRAT